MDTGAFLLFPSVFVEKLDLKQKEKQKYEDIFSFQYNLETFPLYLSSFFLLLPSSFSQPYQKANFSRKSDYLLDKISITAKIKQGFPFLVLSFLFHLYIYLHLRDIYMYPYIHSLLLLLPFLDILQLITKKILTSLISQSSLAFSFSLSFSPSSSFLLLLFLLSQKMRTYNW